MKKRKVSTGGLSPEQSIQKVLSDAIVEPVTAAVKDSTAKLATKRQLDDALEVGLSNNSKRIERSNKEVLAPLITGFPQNQTLYEALMGFDEGLGMVAQQLCPETESEAETPVYQNVQLIHAAVQRIQNNMASFNGHALKWNQDVALFKVAFEALKSANQQLQTALTDLQSSREELERKQASTLNVQQNVMKGQTQFSQTLKHLQDTQKKHQMHQQTLFNEQRELFEQQQKVWQEHQVIVNGQNQLADQVQSQLVVSQEGTEHLTQLSTRVKSLERRTNVILGSAIMTLVGVVVAVLKALVVF